MLTYILLNHSGMIFETQRSKIRHDFRAGEQSINRQGLKHPETLLPHTMTVFSTKNSRVPDKLKVSRTPRDRDNGEENGKSRDEPQGDTD